MLRGSGGRLGEVCIGLLDESVEELSAAEEEEVACRGELLPQVRPLEQEAVEVPGRRVPHAVDETLKVAHAELWHVSQRRLKCNNTLKHFCKSFFWFFFTSFW